MINLLAAFIIAANQKGANAGDGELTGREFGDEIAFVCLFKQGANKPLAANYVVIKQNFRALNLSKQAMGDGLMQQMLDTLGCQGCLVVWSAAGEDLAINSKTYWCDLKNQKWQVRLEGGKTIPLVAFLDQLAQIKLTE